MAVKTNVTIVRANDQGELELVDVVEYTVPYSQHIYVSVEKRAVFVKDTLYSESGRFYFGTKRITIGCSETIRLAYDIMKLGYGMEHVLVDLFRNTARLSGANYSIRNHIISNILKLSRWADRIRKKMYIVLHEIEEYRVSVMAHVRKSTDSLANLCYKVLDICRKLVNIISVLTEGGLLFDDIRHANGHLVNEVNGYIKDTTMKTVQLRNRMGSFRADVRRYK